MENFKDEFLDKIKKYSKKDIIFTDHAIHQAIFRSLDFSEIKENLLNPEKLYFVIKQVANNLNEEKFDCYFIYSKTQCQRYVLILNSKCVICTVIKINRRWQQRFEKNEKR